MKEPWCLAASTAEEPARALVNLYAKRWAIHSLFRQGSMLYELIPTTPRLRLRPMIKQFAQMLAAQPVFGEMFGAIQK